jgi:DnaJ-class molecular chaperone
MTSQHTTAENEAIDNYVKCADCDGTGVGLWRNDECGYCEGNGYTIAQNALSTKENENDRENA